MSNRKQREANRANARKLHVVSAPAVPLCECGRLDDDIYYCTKVEGYPFRCRKELADSADVAHSKAIDSLLDDCATVYGGPFPEGTK